MSLFGPESRSCFVCNKGSDSSPEDALDALLHSGDLELIHEVPLQFATYHVQGLDLTEQFYFVTSVDREQRRGWLYKIHRQNASLNSKIELTSGTLIHPGGVQFDGHYLWIPNAEYRRENRTMIYGVDPNSLEIRRSFPVNDHIGAIASDGKQMRLMLPSDGCSTISRVKIRQKNPSR